MSNHLKVAVIGAGITGLSAAWLLGQAFDVTLFETEPRLGGHANTVDVDDARGSIPIDTGFIVYNTASYPNLIALFDHLDVPTAATDMGFSVSLDNGAYEYAGSGLAGLIGQPRNLVSIEHWRLMRDIFRFFRQAAALDIANTAADVTLGQWLSTNGYSQSFIDAHILPMGAAIWSTPASDMLSFPFVAFARFFANHGLLQTFGRPPWRTVAGGSRAYVSRIVSAFNGTVTSGTPVTSVHTSSGAVHVTTARGTARFDAAILACHADDALRLTADELSSPRAVLSNFRYTRNTAVLHTDTRLMPKSRRLWSSWNYLAQGVPQNDAAQHPISVTYWMNKLQPLQTSTDYFVTLNPPAAIDPQHVLRSFDYAHPLFDRAAINAQRALPALQGRNRLWFAGSYFGYGFHEDGLQAGLAAAEHLSAELGTPVSRPWSWDKASSRIAPQVPLTRSPAEASV